MPSLLPHDMPTLVLLLDAYKQSVAGAGPEYVRCKDIGGTATNARSQSLQRLVVLGFAEKQPRDCVYAVVPLRKHQPMRGRVSFEYRISARGIDVANRFSAPGGWSKV